MSTPQNEIKAGIATAQADATKVVADVKAAQAEVTTLRAKAVAFVAANPGKIVAAVFSILGAVVSHYVWKIL